MRNFKGISSTALRKKLEKCITVQDRTGKFQDFEEEVRQELYKRYRTAIFKAACKCIKLNGYTNQFYAASRYADAVLNGSEIIVLNSTSEITFEQELTQDLISIIHHFSMKMYSNRRQKFKELAKELENENN